MAETIRQKTRRWIRGDFTKSELLGIIGGLVADGAIDVATGGRLAALKKAAIVKTFTLSKPVVSLGGRVAFAGAKGAARVLGSSALGAAAPIVTNPYVAGAALGYGALQTGPGQDLLEMAEERGRMDRIRFEQALTDIEVGTGKAVKKTKSKFNKAVSAGMKAAKNSASYGKKGVINAPKKVFKTVTQIASKINKAKKDPKQRMPLLPRRPGPRAVYNAIKGIFK